jgi:hypothetical protein
MGYGVVGVQHLEAAFTGDLGQFDGERETVVGMPKQAVALDVDGMVCHAGLIGGKAERTLVADEVDLVTATGEFDAQRGGEDTTAADGWVAGEPDTKRYVAHRRGLRIALRRDRVRRAGQ